MTTEQERQGMTHPREGSQPETPSFTRVVTYGVLGSLAGTIAMDVVIVAESLMIGEPVTSYLTLIGSVLGGGAPLGMMMHLVMGSLLGLVFGVAVHWVDLLRIHTFWKGVWLGVLAGLVTIPLGCVPFAVATGVPIAFMVTFSFIPHLVWGAALGIVAGYGLSSATRTTGV